MEALGQKAYQAATRRLIAKHENEFETFRKEERRKRGLADEPYSLQQLSKQVNDLQRQLASARSQIATLTNERQPDHALDHVAA